MLEWARGREAETRGCDVAAHREALNAVALYEKQIAAYHALEPEFRAYVAELVRWTEGRDRWAPMTAIDRATLNAHHERKASVGDFSGQWGVVELDYLD